ncbi:MAG: formate dehydrogenase subunit alpha [Chloracidobacterium sp.]|nr:formate dehydrogenase subunit alpha [Chloracidobacterium sp.]
MSKVENLDRIIKEFGPTLHDEPYGGWRADRVIDKVVQTHCPYCAVQCGMNLLVEDDHVVGFEPRYDFPVNEGKLCPKGVTAYLQAHHPDRLKYPLIKRNGVFERASWEEALDLVVAKFQGLRKEYGQDSLAIYSGSSLTTEKTYVMGKFARVGLQTRYVDYNGRLCMVSAAAGNNKAFGIDRAANPWSDIPLAEVLLIAGANVAETFPVLNKYLWQQRDKGGIWIIIDPRETPTARQGDLHLQLKPGTDVALTNGILHVMIKEGYVDQKFIDERTNGWAETREAVFEKYTPEYCAEITGVPAEKIIKAAHLYGRAATAFVLHARGIEHHSNGVDNVLSYINLVLASGKIGAPGRGYATFTGQGNGQGGREHGQKADQLPGQRSINNPEHRKQVAKIWGIPESEMPQAGVSVVEMFDKMREGEIRGLMSVCNNVMVSMPDTNKIRESLEGLDFYVCIDFFMSESSRYADGVLPGTAWSEDEGVTTNGEGRVLKINKATEPPGEAKPDWWIVKELAERLGRGKFFPYNNTREMFDEMVEASRGSTADYGGITWERIERENGVFWPCPTEDHPGTPRLFEDRFYHPDGRAKFHAVTYKGAAEKPDDEYPLIMTSGRVVFQYLSGNQTRRIKFLVDQCPEPYVEVHPDTAAKLGIRDGERVKVVSRRGFGIFPALVVRTIRPDTIFIPYHWGEELAANQMTNPALDPTSKIPEFKACAARIEKIHSRELPIFGAALKGVSRSEV